MNIKQSVFRLPKVLRKPLDIIISEIEVLLWKTNKQSASMPHQEKMKVLLKYINKSRLKIFVETGTYLGQTVDDLENKFDKVYSIELDNILYQNAKKMFSNNKNVNIFRGDSAEILNKIVKTIKSPALFWLDAHYSGGITAKGSKNTPILKELTIISKNLVKGSVILIDDAREFNGKNDYPKIGVVKIFVSKNFPNYKMKIKQDIIRIYPE